MPLSRDHKHAQTDNPNTAAAADTMEMVTQKWLHGDMSIIYEPAANV